MCGVIKSVLEYAVNICIVFMNYFPFPYFTFPYIKKLVFLWENQLSIGCGRIQFKNCYKAPCFQGLGQGHADCTVTI